MTGGRKRPLEAQVWLCLDLPAGPQRVVEAGREFLRLGFDLLGHELGERVRRAAAAGEYLGLDPYRQVEGGVSAQCGITRVDRTGRQRDYDYPYSPDSFDKVLSGLNEHTPLAGISVKTYGYRPWAGDRLTWTEPFLSVTWHKALKTFEPLPDWVQLYVASTFDHLLGSPQRQQAVLELLTQVAGPANPAGGEVSYRPNAPFSAPLELKLGVRKGRNSVRESRQVVRSYSWVTLISQEIGQRLGGQAALRSSGAFHRVEQLAGGGFLLQATERFEQYQQEQAYRVFRVLAPALPPGVPNPPSRFPPDAPMRPDDDPDFFLIQEDPRNVLDQADGQP